MAFEKFYFLIFLFGVCLAVVRGSDDCPPGEVLSKCGNCRRTCNAPEIDPSCICVMGCMCDSGTVRSHDGSCVPQDKCEPPCDGDLGKVYNPCGNICERTCENIKDPKWNCGICGNVAACTCKEGLVRNLQGQCVLPSDCNVRCRVNEVYTHCNFIPLEERSTCEEPDKSKSYVHTECKSGCNCYDDYVMSKDGFCASRNECQDGCDGDENAYLGSIPCGRRKTCSNVNDEGIFCTPENNPEGCTCKAGFILHQGKCIPTTECPCCNDPNESYLCRSCDITCENMQLNQCYEKECEEGCYCNRGYARNSDGVCIRTDKCPENTSCDGDPNKMYEQCYLDCFNNCIAGDKYKCFDCCAKRGRCVCKPGFKQDPETGTKCLPIEEPPKKCGKNEKLDKCPPTCVPGEKTCKMHMKGQEPECVIDLQKCQPACRCKKGYIRSPKGECVKPENCCTDPNETLVPKPNPCPGGTCAQPKFEECKKKPELAFGCVCKKGFVKTSDTDNTCIAKEKCPKLKCGKNEYAVTCPKKCEPTEETTCSMYMLGDKPTCKKDPSCKPACRCRMGYVRNDKNQCVTPQDCCEDPNSEFKAGANLCPGGTCQQLEQCDDCDQSWVPFGCVCIDGYCKKSQDDPTCVPICDCDQYV